ncbi:MAG: hypoxanthine phosphoribosyltransferase [Opitutales bacterium]|nr:hypoxanthine phosphoribosyltransferase [Opitutales bacterium]
MHRDLQRIMVSEEAIRERVVALSKEISKDYRKVESLTVIAIVNGALMFASDLIRRFNMPVRFDTLHVSSHNDRESRRDPEIIDSLRISLRGHDVLVIDDILDTGNTLLRVKEMLRKAEPASLKSCVLLDKKERREVEVEADYVGFTIEDEFVVGYGLDFGEFYRNLPCIGVLKAELQNPPIFQ